MPRFNLIRYRFSRSKRRHRSPRPYSISGFSLQSGRICSDKTAHDGDTLHTPSRVPHSSSSIHSRWETFILNQQFNEHLLHKKSPIFIHIIPTSFSLFFYILFDIFLLRFFFFFLLFCPASRWIPNFPFPLSRLSSLSSSPSPSLRRWSFYRISLRSSPLSLMCSIKDASFKHTHSLTHAHTLRRALPFARGGRAMKRGKRDQRKKEKRWI